ncbi:MAG: hypothetical protein JJ896_16605 [Rhodothermales bacterium]|nr:hypothetical protein [Rhodothermales bacterium]MBO6781279.1 hypothetical protein [Rhodothermales bacterium]
MAKNDATTRVPHLAEAFALAQVMTNSLEAAESLVVEAYRSAGAANRFALLGAMVTASGMAFDDIEPVPLGAVATPPSGPAAAPADAATSSPSDAATSSPSETATGAPPDAATSSLSATASTSPPDAPVTASPHSDPSQPQSDLEPASLVSARINRELLRDRLARAYAAMDQRDRTVTFLATRGMRAPDDLGTVLGIPAPRAALFLGEAASRLAAQEVCTAEVALDALDLDRFLERPGSELIRKTAGALMRPATRRKRPLRTRVPAVLSLLAIGALTAVAVTQLFPRQEVVQIPPPADALERAAQIVPFTEVELETRSREQAADWFDGRVDWDFAVPNIVGTGLTGVAFPEIATGVRIPVFFFGPSGDQRDITIGVLNYAMLGARADRITLDRATLDNLATGGAPRMRTFEGRTAVALRHRDDIFLVVSRQTDVALPGRVSFPD